MAESVRIGLMTVIFTDETVLIDVDSDPDDLHHTAIHGNRLIVYGADLLEVARCYQVWQAQEAESEEA